MGHSPPVDPGRSEQKRWKAYRAANRLIVGAGIILAEAGIPCQAPEIKALSAALRAVNRAGTVSGPKAVPPAERDPFPAERSSDAQRFRRAAP